LLAFRSQIIVGAATIRTGGTDVTETIADILVKA